MSVRLARARKLLADRLARRGVTASAALIAAALAAEAKAASLALAPAWVPPVLTAAAGVGVGLALMTPHAPAAVSAGAAALARRTSMTLLLSPLKWLAGPVVALLGATGVALVGGPNTVVGPQVVTPGPVAVVLPPVGDRLTNEAQPPSTGAAGESQTVPRKQAPNQVTYVAHNLVIDGTVSDLERAAHQVVGSNPMAAFRLVVSGDPVKHVTTTEADRRGLSVRVVEPKMLAELIRPLDPTETSPISATGAPRVSPSLNIHAEGIFDRESRQIHYRATVARVGEPAGPGTLVVTLPREGGKLLNDGQLPPGARFLAKDRQVVWDISSLAVGQPQAIEFHYKATGAGTYLCRFEATSGPLRAVDETATDVPAAASVDLTVDQADRVVPVGQATYHDFVIRNTGTVDVGRVRLGGSLANFRVIHVFPGDAPGYELEPAEGDRPASFRFLEIPRLAAGQSITVSLELAGLHPGRAMTSATLTYNGADGSSGDTIERSLATVVIAPSPAESSTPTAGPRATPLPAVVERGDRLELGAIPPGYFDLPAADRGKPGSPQPVKVGQVIAVEVLEALPGRPIIGRRLVRDDGTISLDWYGSLHVAGLDRDQIKVKVVERLRAYLNDEVLGLTGYRDDKPVAIRPLETNRVFVDDQPGPDRMAIDSKTTAAPTSRSSARPAGPAGPDPATAELVEKLSGQVADLSSKLDRALGAIEQSRRDRPEGAPR